MVLCDCWEVEQDLESGANVGQSLGDEDDGAGGADQPLEGAAGEAAPAELGEPGWADGDLLHRAR